MRKVLNGVLCDTEKAELIVIGEWREKYEFIGDDERWETKTCKERECLYRGSKNGVYFFSRERTDITIAPKAFYYFWTLKKKVHRVEDEQELWLTNKEYAFSVMCDAGLKLPDDVLEA